MHSTLYAHKYTCINRSHTQWCIKKVITLPLNWLYRDHFPPWKEHFYKDYLGVPLHWLYSPPSDIIKAQWRCCHTNTAMESLKLNSKGKSDDLVFFFFLPTKKKIYQLLGNVSLMRESNFIDPGILALSSQMFIPQGRFW